MRYLLDTNTCIDLMRNHPAVIRKMSAQSPDDCAITSVTGFELFVGVEKCASPDRERSKVERLLNTVHELPFDAGAAREAARIRAFLEKQVR